jgi:hypothetical protein
MSGRPILVTGAHRSGTTWVGKMLALAPGTAYVHEPFNPLTSPGICAAPFDRFFVHVAAQNSDRYEPFLRRTLRFDYDLRRQLGAIRSPRDVLYSARDLATFARARATSARPVVKDPIALFSAEWLEERFGMDVVVVIRHPAAFAASLVRLGWTHDFGGFLEDEHLLEGPLRPFGDEIRGQAEAPGDPLDQAILLWRLCYHTAAEYRRDHAGWVFVRHEDIARAPVASFEQLFGRLELTFTARARRGIERGSASTNPPQPRSAHGVRADSRAVADGWRSRLGAEQIERVRTGTGDVWPLFYADEDW